MWSGRCLNVARHRTVGISNVLPCRDCVLRIVAKGKHVTLHISTTHVSPATSLVVMLPMHVTLVVFPWLIHLPCVVAIHVQ